MTFALVRLVFVLTVAVLVGVQLFVVLRDPRPLAFGDRQARFVLLAFAAAFFEGFCLGAFV